MCGRTAGRWPWKVLGSDAAARGRGSAAGAGAFMQGTARQGTKAGGGLRRAPLHRTAPCCVPLRYCASAAPLLRLCCASAAAPRSPRSAHTDDVLWSNPHGVPGLGQPRLDGPKEDQPARGVHAQWLPDARSAGPAGGRAVGRLGGPSQRMPGTRPRLPSRAAAQAGAVGRDPSTGVDAPAWREGVAPCRRLRRLAPNKLNSLGPGSAPRQGRLRRIAPHTMHTLQSAPLQRACLLS